MALLAGHHGVELLVVNHPVSIYVSLVDHTLQK